MISFIDAKGSTQTNKKVQERVQIKRAKGNPKAALVWRTGLSGAPGSSTPNLPPSGIRGGRSAIIHRTVWCAKRSNGRPCNGRLQRNSKTLQCATARTEVRAGAEGAPDIEHDLSDAPPDCPVAPLSEAPTVGTQRLGDVAGAPDCPVRHTTEALTNGSFGGWGYKYPQPPHFNASKFSAIKPLIRALDFIQRHNQRDQILSQVRNHSNQISD
jgi:hypothetical protein